MLARAILDKTAETALQVDETCAHKFRMSIVFSPSMQYVWTSSRWLGGSSSCRLNMIFRRLEPLIAPGHCQLSRERRFPHLTLRATAVLTSRCILVSGKGDTKLSDAGAASCLQNDLEQPAERGIGPSVVVSSCTG